MEPEAALESDPVALAAAAIIHHDQDVKALLEKRQEELTELIAHPDKRPADAHRDETNQLSISAINRRVELVKAYHRAREGTGAAGMGRGPATEGKR
jgi:hypothetical protein